MFYSHASFARLIEWAFNVPSLGAADDVCVDLHGERTEAGEPPRPLRLLGIATETKLILPTRTPIASWLFVAT